MPAALGCFFPGKVKRQFSWENSVFTEPNHQTDDLRCLLNVIFRNVHEMKRKRNMLERLMYTDKITVILWL